MQLKTPLHTHSFSSLFFSHCSVKQADISMASPQDMYEYMCEYECGMCAKKRFSFSLAEGGKGEIFCEMFRPTAQSALPDMESMILPL